MTRTRTVPSRLRPFALPALLGAALLASGCRESAASPTAPGVGPAVGSARGTALGKAGADGARQEAAALAELEALAREIEGEVAALRGRAFKRAVPVEIADVDAFEAYAAVRMESVGDQRQRDAQELIAKLLGLVPVDMDLWAESLALIGGQVGGYYDPDRDTFSIMEGVSGPLARSILAHELVHALDDQHFEIGAGLEARAEDTDRLAAYHAVVEGSAMVIQGAWTIQHIGEFSAEDLEAMSDVTPQELFDAPAYVWLPVLFSYFRGQAFLQQTESLMAAQTRGIVIAQLDAAFEDPPRSTEQILHPAKYWDPERADEPVAVSVAVADPASGWQPVEGVVLGELGLFLVADGDTIEAPNLANPMSVFGVEFTSDAARGWEGDRAQLFERGAQRLLLLATAWESEADRDEFARAVEGRADELAAIAGRLARARGLGVHSVVTQPVGEREFRLVIGLGVGDVDLVGAPFVVTVGD